MRALAEYIMRGRVQAALIAVLIVPVIPQAALALVTLRRGALDGLWVLFWAFAPLIIGLWSDAAFLPLAMMSAGILVTIFVGALLLRSQLSWTVSLTVIAGIIVVLSVIYSQVFATEITAFLQAVIEFQKANLESQGIAYDESLMQLPPIMVLMAVPAFGGLINVVVALLVGRWWQSLLYNPGGFRQEFRQLQLPRNLALGLILLSALCVVSGYVYWSRVTALPLVMVSIALAHQFAAVQRMGLAWLVIFYLALLSLPFYLMMAVIGCLDSWTNLRGRLLLATKQDGSKHND